jgi:hypothetical protein
VSAETNLYATLSAASAVTALVSARIYPDVVPLEEAVPSIAYSRVDTEFVNTIHGASVAQFANLEVVCMAVARDVADDLADKAAAALAVAGWLMQSRRQEFDDEAGLWGTVLSVRLFTT